MCQRRNIETNKTFLKTNECESITKENPWDTLETVVHSTFIALMIMSKKKSEKVQISDLMKQIKNLEKQQTKSKPIRQQDIVKIRAKIDTI